MKNKLLLLLLLIFPVAAFSGGSNWYVKQGGVAVNIGYEFIKTDKYFDNDGERQDIFEYYYSSANARGMYGITDNLSAGFSLPAVVYMSGNITVDNETFDKSASHTGDIEFYLKYLVYKTEKSKVLIKGRGIIPSGEDNDKYGFNTGYGTFCEGLGAEYIYTHNEKLYMQAYGGFLHRGNDFTDEVYAGGDVGYQLLSELWTAFTCRAINPLENGDDKKRGGLPGFAANNSGYIRLGLQLNLGVSKSIDIYARGEYPVKGQFVQAAPVFEGGISIFFGNGAKEEEAD